MDTNSVISIGQVVIPFHEKEILAILGENGEIYVPVRPLVETIGLRWSGQYERLKRDAVLSEVMKVLSVRVTRTDKGDADVDHVCLPKQFIHGFLFGISANRIKDSGIREQVIQYQREVHLVLDAAFTGDEDSAIAALRHRYRKQGYDDAWIEQRLISVATRNELTAEWDNRGVQKKQYGILTAVVHRGTFGMNPSDHRELKGIKRGNVRDHMTGLELAFINLAEQATIDETQQRETINYQENYDAAEEGGRAAGDARQAFEKRTGRKVISDKSYLEERKEIGKPEQENLLGD